MNELVFFAQIATSMLFLFLSLRLGKSALICFIFLLSLAANIFLLKQTELFGFSVTCSDVYAVGSFLGLSLLQEFFGKKEAIFCTYISFFCLIFFSIMTVFHLGYTPATYDSTQGAYQTIFSIHPRIIASSIFSFFVSQRVDISLFSFLKKRLSSLLWVRIMICLILSQLLDTALFSMLALSGQVVSLSCVILFSFAIKVITGVLNTGFLSIFRKYPKSFYEQV